jgi:hypothetical protein
MKVVKNRNSFYSTMGNPRSYSLVTGILRSTMNYEFFHNFLSEMENLQMFALCKDFDELTLEDGGSSSSSSTTDRRTQPLSYRTSILHLLRNWKNSVLSHSVIEKLGAPFIEIPRNLMDLSSYNITMGLGFRFLPGQTDFLLKEFSLPESFDSFSFISNSLGLSYISRPLPDICLYPYSCSGSGIRSILPEDLNRILVEVITQFDGRYGRFLILVIMGVGCTVWYGFVTGSPLQGPSGSLFSRIDSYDQFFNMHYYAPGFRRICLIERMDFSALIESTMENEHPFSEIKIPASGPVLKSVGLGLMIAFFLAVGIVPNVSDAVQI